MNSKSPNLMNLQKEYNDDVQCVSCRYFGVTRKQDELYWTCNNCGEVGGIFIEPIKFHIRIGKNQIKWVK